MSLNERIDEVLDIIARGEEQSGRDRGSVKLVAVTKTVDVQTVNAAIKHGIGIIGENKVQELFSKYDDLEKCEKHFIGSLQSNKAAGLVGKVELIQSLSTLSAAKAIQKEAESKQIDVRALLQVNIGYEDTKSGIAPLDIKSFIESIAEHKNIKIAGLMCIPPNLTPDDARRNFSQMREISERLSSEMPEIYPKKPELSMGMSGDFFEAILEGATYVRIGSRIFGDR